MGGGMLLSITAKGSFPPASGSASAVVHRGVDVFPQPTATSPPLEGTYARYAEGFPAAQ
jgi:hypothetical protein